MEAHHLDELLTRLKRGGSADTAELVDVTQLLREVSLSVDLYAAIYILGLANATDRRDLIESFLAASDDPMLARISLQVLCQFWGYTEVYIPQVRSFIVGVAWDRDDDVRLMAVAIAGTYLAEHSDPALLASLVRIANNGDERHLVRQAAIDALGASLHLPLSERPSASRLEPLDSAKCRQIMVLFARGNGP